MIQKIKKRDHGHTEVFNFHQIKQRNFFGTPGTIQYNLIQYKKMFIQSYHIGIATFPGALLTNKGM